MNDVCLMCDVWDVRDLMAAVDVRLQRLDGWRGSGLGTGDGERNGPRLDWARFAERFKTGVCSQ